MCYGWNLKVKQENNSASLQSFLFNLILPIIILEKLGGWVEWGDYEPHIVLTLCLAFPVFYGSYEFLKFRTKNFISLLGVVNVLLTGILSLQAAEPLWFILKEGLFPMVIGLATIYTAYTAKPLIKILFFQPQVLDVGVIEKVVKERGNEKGLIAHFRKTTLYLSSSFFLSSLLNFALAFYVFQNIPSSLSPTEIQEALNAQISKMFWMSFLVISLPLILVGAWILKVFMDGLKELTGIPFQELMVKK